MPVNEPPDLVLQRVPVSRILDLRCRVLRPGRPAETARFESDDAATTRHYAALVDGEVVTCLSLVATSWEGRDAWQLRGMATADRHRRQGFGSRLLAHAVAELRHDGASRVVWCNARVGAIDFYRSLGWIIVSEPFEIAGIGPHVRMLCAEGC